MRQRGNNGVPLGRVRRKLNEQLSVSKLDFVCPFVNTPECNNRTQLRNHLATFRVKFHSVPLPQRALWSFYNVIGIANALSMARLSPGQIWAEPAYTSQLVIFSTVIHSYVALTIHIGFRGRVVYARLDAQSKQACS